jgi:hypothetical protein
MKPKSVSRLVAASGAGSPAGWAGAGVEMVATGGLAGAGFAGWAVVGSASPPWQAESATVVRMASDTIAIR